MLFYFTMRIYIGHSFPSNNINKVIMDTLKCLFGLHKYDIYKEEPLTDYTGTEIGKVIICKCTRCGRLKVYKIRTKNTDY